jgi:hypothetical protein
VTFAELRVVFTKIMPEHLEKRSVQDGENVCRAVMAGLSVSDHGVTGSSVDDVFSRLGGN